MITYYLYVKTHIITGLNYMGQTSRNPMSYKGSGKYWRRHIEHHGKEYVVTKVILRTTCKHVLRLMGSYYSKKWNIVQSKYWANLKYECGDGGPFKHSEESKKLMSTQRRGKTYEEAYGEEAGKRLRKIRSEGQRGSKHWLYGKKQTAESNFKRSQSLKGRIKSEETKVRMSLASFNKTKMTCPHCGKIGQSNMYRYHFDNCKSIGIKIEF